jgi:hypothetical protein
MKKDFDYYLFWAEDFYEENYDELILLPSEMKVQIKCAHILIDQGSNLDYQKDGYELGKIIWPAIEKRQKEVGYIHE